jgi:hypothetical protein
MATSILDRILICHPDIDFIRADGLDSAVIGVDTSMRLVYSVKKCIKIHTKEMGRDGAIEFLEFNVFGSSDEVVYCDDDY